MGLFVLRFPVVGNVGVVVRQPEFIRRVVVPVSSRIVKEAESVQLLRLCIRGPRRAG